MRPPLGNLPRKYGRAQDIRRGDTPVHSPGHAPPDPTQSTTPGKPAQNPQEFPQGTWQGYHWASILTIAGESYRETVGSLVFSWFSARTLSHCLSANAIPPNIHSTGAMAAAERLN